MGLSLEWTKGVSPDRKEGIVLAIRNSTVVAAQVLKLCDEWEAELTAAETKVADFDTPSWAYKQAYRNGDRARIRKLRDLFSFIKEK